MTWDRCYGPGVIPHRKCHTRHQIALSALVPRCSVIKGAPWHSFCILRAQAELWERKPNSCGQLVSPDRALVMDQEHGQDVRPLQTLESSPSVWPLSGHLCKSDWIIKKVSDP